MSVLEIVIVVLFSLGASIYIILAIYDLKHPERKEQKKKKKQEKRNEKDQQKNNKEGMY